MRLNQVVIEAALEYVGAGFSVIPIKTDGSKQPPPLEVAESEERMALLLGQRHDARTIRHGTTPIRGPCLPGTRAIG